ncbi:hypothetical protein K461DRAFT_313393 [Myriangium duriaei CBS 260.36]|uniref:Deoxyribonuclease NucA/NucB domain-containing protein n=1 Tax=Myriangium duriaei CBS 260.36 TaxID=1168546 RepID=A0A9P4J3V6_9PEZI|nr:hypothetical protein K461DRAFT_313393 [Myriangium duriaei CBS 260.36]
MVGKLFYLSILYDVSIAAPTADRRGVSSSLLRRGDRGSKTNPIPATFDITQWPDIAEENCYVMFCKLNGNRLFQRLAELGNKGDPPKNRKKAGAAQGPFRKDDDHRKVEKINADTTSAEEFPWASTQQGGPQAYILPATEAQQNAQKLGIKGGYDRADLIESQWFTINFKTASGAKYGKYCDALFNTKSNSICTEDPEITLFGTRGVKLSKYIYKADYNPDEPPAKRVKYEHAPPTKGDSDVKGQSPKPKDSSTAPTSPTSNSPDTKVPKVPSIGPTNPTNNSPDTKVLESRPKIPPTSPKSDVQPPQSQSKDVPKTPLKSPPRSLSRSSSRTSRKPL